LDPEHLANVATFAPLSIGQYLKQIFWSSQHSLYYRWPHVEIPITTLELLSSLAIALASCVATLYCCRNRKDLAFYLLSFYACLLPYLNVVYVGIWRADRYVYFSAFCLLAIAVSLALQLHERGGRGSRYAIAGLAMAMVLNFGVKTWQQQAVWRSNQSLWEYEAYRDEASLLSIQALAKHWMRKAESTTDPEQKRALAAASRQEIARGFEREAALGRVPAPYATSEQLQLARFHYLLGRLATLERAPLQLQIRHFETSREIAPNRTNTLMLAGAYFELAFDAPYAGREALVHRSLDFFMEHVQYTKSDPVRYAKSLTLLSQNYEAHFPFLQERIQQMKAMR
jgi:hypothetical protein